jgi:hypothetical protein
MQYRFLGLRARSLIPRNSASRVFLKTVSTEISRGSLLVAEKGHGHGQ